MYKGPCLDKISHIDVWERALQFAEVWAESGKFLLPSAANGNSKKMLDFCRLFLWRFNSLLAALWLSWKLLILLMDRRDQGLFLGVFVIDFNNNRIQAKAGKPPPCLSYEKYTFIALHSPLGKQFAHLSAIWSHSNALAFSSCCLVPVLCVKGAPLKIHSHPHVCSLCK